jgi:multidrug efflux system membrane fusion protein
MIIRLMRLEMNRENHKSHIRTILAGKPANLRKWAIRILVALFSIAVIVFVIIPKMASRSEAPPPASARQMVVKIIELSPQTLEFTRDYTARISDDSRTTISARLSTTIESIYFREGDVVRAGDVLALLDTHDVRTDMHRAEASVAKIKADIDFFEKQLKIDTALYQGGAISQTALDDTARKLKGLRASINQQESNLKLSEQKLGYGKIYAPVSGRIQAVFVSKGEQVAPGKPVMEIIGNGNYKAVITIPERDMNTLALGTPAYIQLPDDTFWTGHVDRIYPALDDRTHTGSVDVHLDPQISKKFFVGSMAHAKLVKANHKNTLAVPAQAIFTRDGSYGVFVERDGIAHWAPIIPGPSNGRQTIIKSGLDAGVHVITTPYPGLNEGVNVRVFKGAPS